MPPNRFRSKTSPSSGSIPLKNLTPGIPKAVTAAKETHDAFSAPFSGSDFPLADGTASFSGAGFPLDLRPPVFFHRADPSLALDDSGLLHLFRSRHDSRALSGVRVPFEVYCPSSVISVSLALLMISAPEFFTRYLRFCSFATKEPPLARIRSSISTTVTFLPCNAIPWRSRISMHDSAVQGGYPMSIPANTPAREA